MKKIVLNLVVIGFSFMSLYAFTQLNRSHVLFQHAQQGAYNAKDILENNWPDHPASTEEQQKVIEETIPRFHQQLSTFVPF